MIRRSKKRVSNNDEFLTKNFERIVNTYPHQRIVICNEKIFTGSDAVEKARRKFPRKRLMWMPVPSAQELKHHLL